MDKLLLLKKLSYKKSDNLFLQSFRYAVGGGIAFVVDFSFLFLLTHYGHVYYLLSAAFAYMLGSTIHYLYSILAVFPSRSYESRAAEFMIFALIGVVGLAMNEVFMWFFTSHLGFHYLYSKLIATGFIFFWNFSTRKFVLFR